MFCQSCGKQIPDDSVFCRFCGHRQEEIKPVPVPSAPPPAPPPIKLIVPTEAPAPRRAEPSAPVSIAAPAKATPVVPTTPVAHAPAIPVAAAVPVAAAIPVHPAAPARSVTTSGDWDFTDFVFSFAGRKMPALKVSGRNGISLPEASKLYWQSYGGEISAELQRWAARGWQPTTSVGPEVLEMRKFNGYRDKNLLFWIIVIVAAIPSVGMSIIWGLIPAAFVEPFRFVAKMRAPHGTPLP